LERNDKNGFISFLSEGEGAVLESVEDPMNLNYVDLKSKLELRFGEGHLSQNFYGSFTSRKQKVGEDFASFESDLERLCRLAYPEGTFAL